jgi:hypothetical protein
MSGRVGDPSHVDDVNGDNPTANLMREVEALLKGVDLKKLLSNSATPPPGFKSAVWRGGSYNGIAFLTLDDGRKIALKADKALYGAEAEDAVARFYRDLGLPQPMVRPLEGDLGRYTNRVFLMQMSGDVDPRANGVAYDGRPSYRRMNEAAKKEAFLAAIANDILGQSDRHNGNIMHVTTPDGDRPILIDNGLMWFNSGGVYADTNFDANDPSTWLKTRNLPSKFAAGGVKGNWNVLNGLATEYIREFGEDRARDEMVEFAKRMQERAKVVRFRDQRYVDFVQVRAQWVIDNVDQFLGALS